MILSWMAYPKFWYAVLDVLGEYAKDLFVRHHGNSESAAAEVRQLIRDHGKRRKDAEAAMDAELADDAAKKRAAAGAFGKDDK